VKSTYPNNGALRLAHDANYTGRASARLLDQAGDGKDLPHHTDRETGIFTALARGAGNKQIARSLDISEKTVRNHISNIYEKPRIYER
jgi:DNA-binding NarL/FixJ family response regulator